MSFAAAKHSAVIATTTSTPPQLSKFTTKFQYTHGFAQTSRISSDAYTFDPFSPNRPGNDGIQMDLFYNCATKQHGFESSLLFDLNSAREQSHARDCI
jgi:hypothetical protein